MAVIPGCLLLYERQSWTQIPPSQTLSSHFPSENHSTRPALLLARFPPTLGKNCYENTLPFGIIILCALHFLPDVKFLRGYLTANYTAGGTGTKASQHLNSPDLSIWSNTVSGSADGSGAVGSVAVAVFLPGG